MAPMRRSSGVRVNRLKRMISALQTSRIYRIGQAGFAVQVRFLPAGVQGTQQHRVPLQAPHWRLPLQMRRLRIRRSLQGKIYKYLSISKNFSRFFR